MMSESTYQDSVRTPGVEYLKRQIVRRFDAALVGGRRQKEYSAFLGLPADRIFLGYDVVDNEFFARGAAEVRQQEELYRHRYGLPKEYFLTVSRFIEKKNLHFLIDTYKQYRGLAGNDCWDLVLCGSGPLNQEIKDRARDISGIHLPGFKQADELPVYYGLAGVFILPSSHFEQWGLVVNEAMASGLPILVSQVCGCTPELVHEGVNGFTFDPGDSEALSRLMLKMTSEEVALRAMGEASSRMIAAWSPETFAENLIRAITIAGS
jgi:1,2-diacylglycerol 3-alpha-glucosyltransferase